jgi:hypothetical protein
VKDGVRKAHQGPPNCPDRTGLRLSVNSERLRSQRDCLRNPVLTSSAVTIRCTLLPIADAFMKRVKEAGNALLIAKIHKYRRNAAAVGIERVCGSCQIADSLE